MDSLKWSPEQALGIPAIDKAHKRFMLKLSETVGAPDLEFGLRFFSIVEDLERDFKEEERLMQAASFYDAGPHRRQHARMLAALYKYIPDVLAGESGPARKMLEQFPEWFLFHVSTMDVLLSVWLKMKSIDLQSHCNTRTCHEP